MEAGEVAHPATEHDSSEYWLRRFPTPNLNEATKVNQLAMVAGNKTMDPRDESRCVLLGLDGRGKPNKWGKVLSKKKWGKEHTPHGPDGELISSLLLFYFICVE